MSVCRTSATANKIRRALLIVNEASRCCAPAQAAPAWRNNRPAGCTAFRVAQAAYPYPPAGLGSPLRRR
jgi:hypothetical protein